MLSQDVPQWVVQSFLRSALAEGATATQEEILATFQTLVQMWNEPDRYHHDIRHLLDMLKRIDTMAPETPHANRVRLAAWFHGIVFSTSDLAVYTRNGGEDEIASAKVAEQYLAQLGIGDDERRAIKKLIVGMKKSAHSPIASSADGTAGAAEPRADETSVIEMIDMDSLALRDAHLGALAVEPQKYRHYLEEIRAEYAHIRYAHFLFARLQIVSKLLARKKLFNSPLAQQWEQPARENLVAEQERLKAAIAELDNNPVRDATTGDLAASAASPAQEQTAEQTPEQDSDQAAPLETPPQLDPLTAELPATRDVAASGAPVNKLEHTSSLEKLDAMFSPGRAPRINMTPEQAAREERKQRAAKAWEAIEAKRNSTASSEN